MIGRNLLVAVSLMTLALGCSRRALYEWRDEPYLRPVYAKGEAEARARMASVFASDRDIGCRVLSVVGREALRTGDEATARRIAAELMEHYRTETNLEVRSSILALCLRNVGRGNEQVAAFLRQRLATYEMVVSSAFTLATLEGDGAYEAIHGAYEVTREANDYEHRYELLLALWLLGDARGVPVFESALAEVEGEWPAKIHHMKKATYAKTLSGRLETLKVASK